MGKAYLRGVVLPAGATSEAPLRIPHGSAPSSPVNGDVWTTTAGIYVRINGATIGPLGTGGGGGGGSVTISDTAPGSPTAGDLWWESDTGILSLYYSDGTSSQWVEVGYGGGGPSLAVTFASLASPTFTGTPAAPTAAVDTDTTQIATTEWVINQKAGSVPLIDGTAAIGSSLRWAAQDHVHPTDTTRAALAGATFTGAVALAAGTTSLAPLGFSSGSVLTSAQGGAMEFDGDAFYLTPDGSAVGGRAVNVSSHIYSLTATRNLTNGTGAQSIFGVGLTVAGSTTYEIEMVVAISCSGTTTAIKSLSFGGTATLTSIGYDVRYTHSATSVATSAAANEFWVATAASTNMGATSTTNYSRYMVKGLVRVNASGTFIPQVAWSAGPGAAPVVQINSFVKMTPIGTNTVTTVGAWA